MSRTRLFSVAAAILLAGAALAQEKAAPPAGFDPEACAKHCREMAAERQKGMDAHKAMAEKNTAAWKQIRASVEEAKKARGEKKVAALETALDRLVSFHEQMMSGMADGKMPGMGGMPGGHPMHHGGPGCCGDMHAMGDCCMHSGHGMSDDCPMMKKGD